MKTVTFTSEITDAEGRVWLRIADNGLDLDTTNISDVVLPPSNTQFIAKHNDQSKIKLQFRTYKIRELETWLRSEFLQNHRTHKGEKFRPELAKEFVKTIIDARAVDSDENVPIMEISGQLQTPEVKVVIRRNTLKIDIDKSIFGRPELVNFHPHLVNEVARLSLTYDPSRHGGREFFGIG